MTTLEELKFKRKNSIIVVCTLGFAAIFDSRVRPAWMANIFEGTSMDSGALGFVLKIFSFVFLGLLTAAIMFVIHLFKLIYYQIEISRLTPKTPEVLFESKTKSEEYKLEEKPVWKSPTTEVSEKEESDTGVSKIRISSNLKT